MIHCLISGRLTADPRFGTTKTDKPYANASVAVKVEGAEQPLFVSVFTMDERSIGRLRRIGKGDGISASGALGQRTYEKDGEQRTGWSLAFAEILTARPRPRASEHPDGD
jgi:single-stranded DNA-binding protein